MCGCAYETEEQVEKTAMKQMLRPSVTNTQWLSLVRKKMSPSHTVDSEESRNVNDIKKLL